MMGALRPRRRGAALVRAAPALQQAPGGVSGWGVRFGVCTSAVNVIAQIPPGPAMAVGDTGVGASLPPMIPSKALGGGAVASPVTTWGR